MADKIEEKALALVNAVLADEKSGQKLASIDRSIYYMHEALCRTIEAHEADKQAFSDAVEEHFGDAVRFAPTLSRFIIAKPDPLVEALREALTRRHIVPSDEVMQDEAAWLRQALKSRGLGIGRIGEIVEANNAPL